MARQGRNLTQSNHVGFSGGAARGPFHNLFPFPAGFFRLCFQFFSGMSFSCSIALTRLNLLLRASWVVSMGVVFRSPEAAGLVRMG